jgi:hypothetical protein
MRQEARRFRPSPGRMVGPSNLSRFGGRRSRHADRYSRFASAGFPSGQRGSAVNRLALPSQVRILPPPLHDPAKEGPSPIASARRGCDLRRATRVILILAVLAAGAFAYVAVDEIEYVEAHKYFGPAVISDELFGGGDRAV